MKKNIRIYSGHHSAFAFVSVIAISAALNSPSVHAMGRSPSGATSGNSGNSSTTDPCTAPPVPSLDGTVRVDLSSLSGFTSSQTTKVTEAAEIVRRVINSEEFKQRVLNFHYNGKDQFVSTTLTNAQVYDTILAAKETYTGNTDSVAQLCLNIYTPPFYKKWSVVGYGYPGDPHIYMNSYYFNSFTTKQIAGNITHEWLHKIGFEHDFNSTAQRPYSVPYALGELVIELADKL